MSTPDRLTAEVDNWEIRVFPNVTNNGWLIDYIDTDTGWSGPYFESTQETIYAALQEAVENLEENVEQGRKQLSS